MPLPKLLNAHTDLAVFWVHLSEVAGWDVWTERGRRGELVAHFEDWHRLERTMARFGHDLFQMDSEFLAS